MQEIEFDDGLHQTGERVSVASHSLRQACAWWVASELVRRHPDDLVVVELHPGGGQYDCVSVMTRGDSRGSSPGVLLHMNKNLAGHFQTEGSSAERFNWLEVLLAPDRLTYVVEQIERVNGLTVTQGTPATVRRSVGPRLISGFLQRTSLGPRGWVAVNGMGDSSSWGSAIRMELFSSIRGMKTAFKLQDPGYFLGDPAYRFWFVCPTEKGDDLLDVVSGGTPAFGVDTWLGRIWNGSGKRIDLMEAYEKVDRRMDALISKVCPPAF